MNSIAYTRLSSPRPGVAPYTMTSTIVQGFNSLSNFSAARLSFDIDVPASMFTTTIINKSADPAIPLNDPVFDDPNPVVYFKTQVGGITHSMERRTYVDGSWTLLDNNGTPNDAADDVALATGTIIRLILFLDYTDGQNFGKGVLTVDPGSAFHAELQKNFGTTSLELISHSGQFPVSQDDPGGVSPAEMYQVDPMIRTAVRLK